MAEPVSETLCIRWFTYSASIECHGQTRMSLYEQCHVETRIPLRGGTQWAHVFMWLKQHILIVQMVLLFALGDTQQPPQGWVGCCLGNHRSDHP